MATESVTEPMTEAELRAWANFPAAIDDETMERMEQGAAANERGIQRRLVLVALARGADVMSHFSISHPAAYGEMLTSIEAFRDHAEALLGSADAALWRMKIADCRHCAVPQSGIPSHAKEI